MITHEEYIAFQKLLESSCGIVLGQGKEYLVNSRLNGLVRKQGFSGFGGMIRALQSANNARLKTAIIDAMTTNETFWFRDMAHFNMLTEKVFPEIAQGRRGGRLRIWSAACSTGQEPYNLSMIATDFRQRSPGSFSAVEILGTDISTRVLVEARSGVYCGLAASRGLSHDQRARYFTPQGDCLTVKQEVKSAVSFRELNLTQGFGSIGRFDIIFCRNVLIYFSSDQKRDIINRMADALNPGGYLFLGSTESLSSFTDRFQMINAFGGIAYKLK